MHGAEQLRVICCQSAAAVLLRGERMGKGKILLLHLSVQLRDEAPLLRLPLRILRGVGDIRIIIIDGHAEVFPQPLKAGAGAGCAARLQQKSRRIALLPRRFCNLIQFPAEISFCCHADTRAASDLRDVHNLEVTARLCRVLK